eukprot:14950800-Alexandrium_andersonii.AAC.1
MDVMLGSRARPIPEDLIQPFALHLAARALRQAWVSMEHVPVRDTGTQTDQGSAPSAPQHLPPPLPEREGRPAVPWALEHLRPGESSGSSNASPRTPAPTQRPDHAEMDSMAAPSDGLRAAGAAATAPTPIAPTPIVRARQAGQAEP